MCLSQIVERGNHDTLMELGGEYAGMWNIQVQEREKMLEMEAVSADTLAVVVVVVVLPSLLPLLRYLSLTRCQRSRECAAILCCPRSACLPLVRLPLIPPVIYAARLCIIFAAPPFFFLVCVGDAFHRNG